MLQKIAFSGNVKIEPLNHPEGWEIFELPKRIKTASIDKSKKDDLDGFNLEAAIEKHPDQLYVKIFAIKQDEVNDNGDCFSGSELKKAAETFIGVPIFTNHQNDDIEKARGECVHSWYDSEAKGIYIIARVDKVAYPKLANGIEQGYITGTSMGCFPGHMRVMMADGAMRPIKDVKPGEFVISGKGKRKKVLNLQNHLSRATDDLIYITAQGLPRTVECTPNHEFLVLKEQKYCAVTGKELKGTKSIRRFEKRTVPGAYQTVAYAEAKHNGVLEGYEYEWKRAEDLSTSDVVLFPINTDEIPHDDATTENAKLIGYFLAEGSFLKYKGKKVGVEFNLSASTEKDTLGKEIETLLNEKYSHLPQKVCVYDRTHEGRDSLVIRLNSEEAAKWFEKHCGEYSDGKELADYVLTWPKEIQRHILLAWLNGDGTLRKVIHSNGKTYRNNSGTTTSEHLFNQMRMIAFRLGIYAGCEEHIDSPKKRNRKPFWTLTLGCAESLKLAENIDSQKSNIGDEYRQSPKRIFGKYVGYKIQRLERKPHIGAVFDLEIEDDHSYIVEGMTVHNCSVEYSCCSICHNKAHTADEYCSHIRNSKNRKLSGTYNCEFHNSKCKPEEDCPVCGCEKDGNKQLKLADQKVFEHNYGLKFIENSFVVNPACHDCGVTCVLHAPEVTKKIAEIRNQFEKLSAAYEKNPNVFSKVASNGKTVKVAGQLELEMLRQSLENMDKVARSMLSQKEYVDLEFPSDLLKVMSGTQEIMDELNEMGYAQLPSAVDATASTPDNPTFPAPAPPPQQASAPMGAQKPITTTDTGSGNRTEVLNGLGSITKPKSAFVEKQKKEIFANRSNVVKKISGIRDITSQLVSNIGRTAKVANHLVDVWVDQNDPNSRRVIIDNEYVTEAQGDSVTRVTKIASMSPELQEMIASRPLEAANQILNNQIKESEAIMADKQEKTAQVGPTPSVDATQREVITEKQLRDNGPKLHPRTEESPDQITQAQLGDESLALNDVTSESPQNRRGTYETTIEDTLDKVTSGHLARWKEYPEVITEKQWTDMSRAVASRLPEDWTERITQSQLRDLLDSHRFVGTYETITEDQLKNQELGIKRWANKAYANALMKVAFEAVSDAVAKYEKTPEEIKRVVAEVIDSDNEKLRNKVAFLTLVNSLPMKNEARELLAQNVNYFRKKASKSSESPSTIESIIFSVAQNAQAGLKVEDVYEAIGYVLGQKKALAKVESLVEKKLAANEPKGDEIFDKFAALNDALDAKEGYQFLTTVSEVGADPKDKKAFVTACKKYAQLAIEEEMGGAGGPITVVEIKVDPATGAVLIEATDPTGGDIEPAVEEADEFSFDDDLEGDMDTDPTAEGGTVPGVESTGELEVIEDETAAHESYDSEADETDESKDATMMTRASLRQANLKQAQMLGGEMGGQGGVSQAPGAGASLPQPPGAGAQPPVESFTEETAEEAIGGPDSDLSPKPPGTLCPVCGSEDVDALGGKSKCNNCGAEYEIRVNQEITKWPELINGGEDEEGDLADDDFSGDGFQMPGGAPELPVAASVRITPQMLQKVAEVRDAAKKAVEANDDAALVKMSGKVENGGYGIPVDILQAYASGNASFGRISPVSASTNTVPLGDHKYVDLSTGTPYSIEFRTNNTGKHIFAQWEWTPKVASNICPSCNRARKKFANALKLAGVTIEQFNKMDLAHKSKLLLQMKKAGHLNQIKTASKEGSVIGDYKKAFGMYGPNFPIETCREKLARRYGKDAVAFSGPCEGELLYDCVCNQLKSAGFYSDGAAIKLASVWGDCDGTEDCIDHLTRRIGLHYRDAKTACSALKMALASDADFLAEEFSEVDSSSDPLNPGGANPNEGLDGTDDLGGDDFNPNDDPFDDNLGGGGGTVTLELSEELAKELDAALDVQLGSNPADDLAPGDDLGGDALGDAATSPSPADDAATGVDPLADDLGGSPTGDDFGGETKPAAMPSATVSPSASDIGAMKPCNDPASKTKPCGDGTTAPKVVIKSKNEEGFSNGSLVKDETDLKLEQGKMSEASDENQIKYEEARRNRSSIGGVGKINMDISALAAALEKLQKNAGEKEISNERAQDVKDIGSYSEGNPLSGKTVGTMGHENETIRDAKHPQVPRDKALMGHEDDDLNPQDKPQPKIPSDKALMGHEDEAGLGDVSGDTRYTGGVDGKGKIETASSEEAEQIKEAQLLDQLAQMRGVVGNAKRRTDSLADRILSAGKLKAPKPVSDDKDIQPISNGETMGHEEAFSAQKPTNTEGSGDESMMGHEKETLGSRPTSPKDHPDIAEDNQLMGHEEEEIGPEKQTENKGTVIASSDAESGVKLAARQAEAFRVAGRMLEGKLITSAQLQKKVQELAQYEIGQIRDIEKAIFTKASKGFATASEGLETALVINSASNQRNGADELKSKLSSLFTLNTRNELAKKNPDFEERRAFGR